MMIEEFTKLTGYTPTFEEYAKIERDYYAFDGDKQEFCAVWLIQRTMAHLTFQKENKVVKAFAGLVADLIIHGLTNTKAYKGFHKIYNKLDF